MLTVSRQGLSHHIVSSRFFREIQTTPPDLILEVQDGQSRNLKRSFFVEIRRLFARGVPPSSRPPAGQGYRLGAGVNREPPDANTEDAGGCVVAASVAVVLRFKLPD